MSVFALVRPCARALGATTLTMLLGSSLGFAGEAGTYRVTIRNLSESQPLSPPVGATHEAGSVVFELGGLASAELEILAEDGDPAPLFALLAARATQAVDVGRPLAPSGQTAGGFPDWADFLIEARDGDRLSLATMLICTNDGFTGLGGARIGAPGSLVHFTRAYDAGTEDNTEISLDIPDPCSALGPAELDGDPNGNLEGPAETDPRDPIGLHPGVAGIGDLLPEHAFADPIARVTVTRLDPEAVRFAGPLLGGAENPPVDTRDRGRAVLRVIDRFGGATVGWRLFAFDASDAFAAHVHHGLPHENGPIVATLWTGTPGGPSLLFEVGEITEDDLEGPFARDLPGFLTALRNGELYVNVHTTENPSGEIRGQLGAATLVRPPLDATPRTGSRTR